RTPQRPAGSPYPPVCPSVASGVSFSSPMAHRSSAAAEAALVTDLLTAVCATTCLSLPAAPVHNQWCCPPDSGCGFPPRVRCGGQADPLGRGRRQPEHNRHATIIADSGAPREPVGKLERTRDACDPIPVTTSRCHKTVRLGVWWVTQSRVNRSC